MPSHLRKEWPTNYYWCLQPSPCLQRPLASTPGFPPHPLPQERTVSPKRFPRDTPDASLPSFLHFCPCASLSPFLALGP